MQFYLNIWLDSGCTLTLSKLGEWEQSNFYEYEAYITAYLRRMKIISDARKKMKK